MPGAKGPDGSRVYGGDDPSGGPEPLDGLPSDGPKDAIENGASPLDVHGTTEAARHQGTGLATTRTLVALGGTAIQRAHGAGTISSDLMPSLAGVLFGGREVYRELPSTSVLRRSSLRK